jgi:hypothetical protein
MAAIVSIAFSADAQRLIAEWRTVEQRLADAIDDGFSQFITEVESSIKVNELTGGEVNVRTGSLRQDVTGQVDGPLSGFVGTARGSTTPYARTILGPDETTIRPVNANHLWVPIADNLNPSGVARYSPKALYETFGKDRIKIFTSKAGNTVVFVEDQDEAGKTQRYKRNSYSKDNKAVVRRKGQAKGKLMFVLKDEVVIQGTDALAKGAQRMMPRGQELLTAAIRSALPGGRA